MQPMHQCITTFTWSCSDTPATVVAHWYLLPRYQTTADIMSSHTRQNVILFFGLYWYSCHIIWSCCGHTKERVVLQSVEVLQLKFFKFSDRYEGTTVQSSGNTTYISVCMCVFSWQIFSYFYRSQNSGICPMKITKIVRPYWLASWKFIVFFYSFQNSKVLW